MKYFEFDQNAHYFVPYIYEKSLFCLFVNNAVLMYNKNIIFIYSK